jgi:excisionase family DNA binding protein
MEERHFSLSDVAIGLRVSERTVRRWIKSGKLRAYKPGRDFRIPESAVRELIEEGEVSPKARAAQLLEPTLDDVLADERLARATGEFVERVRTYIAERVANYELRLRQAEEDPAAASYVGAGFLLDDAIKEFVHLPDLYNGELAHRWLLDPEIPEDVKVALGRTVGDALQPLIDIVGRIADRAPSRRWLVLEQNTVPRLREVA